MQLVQHMMRCDAGRLMCGQKKSLTTESRRVKTNAGRVDGMTTVERHILDYGGALIPGCYDAMSARIMARQGYKVRIRCRTASAFAMSNSIFVTDNSLCL